MTAVLNYSVTQFLDCFNFVIKDIFILTFLIQPVAFMPIYSQKFNRSSLF